MKATIQHPGHPYLFDRLFAYCRKFWSAPIEYLDQAHLFFLPDFANPAPDHPPELWDWAEDNFALPFQVSVFEGYGSCFMIYDLMPMANGLKAPRAFIECITMDDRLGSVFDTDQEAADLVRTHLMRDLKFRQEEVREVCRVNVGFLMSIDVDKSSPTRARTFKGMLNDTFLMHPTRGKIRMAGDSGDDGEGMPDQDVAQEDGSVEIVTQEDVKKAEHMVALQSAVVSLEEILAYNLPHRFVVERTEFVKKKRRALVRVDDRSEPATARSRFSLLTPEQIRLKFSLDVLSDAQQAKVPVTPRRWRTGTTGQGVLAPAGCTPAMEGKHRIGKSDYQVRLDL